MAKRLPDDDAHLRWGPWVFPCLEAFHRASFSVAPRDRRRDRRHKDQPVQFLSILSTRLREGSSECEGSCAGLATPRHNQACWFLGSMAPDWVSARESKRSQEILSPYVSPGSSGRARTWFVAGRRV